MAGKGSCLFLLVEATRWIANLIYSVLNQTQNKTPNQGHVVLAGNVGHKARIKLIVWKDRVSGRKCGVYQKVRLSIRRLLALFTLSPLMEMDD